MSTPPVPLHGSLGAMFIGLMLATSLHGISIVQAYYYYKHQKDNRYIVSLVTAVMLFDTINQGMITHTVYIYLISNWGNVDGLGQIVKSLAFQNIFNALTGLLVQSFMVVRVWRLSNGNILLTTINALFVLAEFVSVIVFTVFELQFETFVQLITLKSFSLTVNILAAVGDLLIAVSLCMLLYLSRTGIQKSDTVTNKLMLFALNTGLLTSFCALASFIAYMTAPNTLVYVTFYFCIGRLYTNSLLATLNVYKMIPGGFDVSPSLPEFSKSGAGSRQRGASDMSININTKELVTDFTHDQLDDKNEKSSSNTVTGV